MKARRVNGPLLAMIVFCIGTLFTYYLSTEVKNRIQQESATRLQTLGQQLAIRLQESIDITVNDLRALQAHYEISPEVDRLDFIHYVEVLLHNSPGHIQALEWIPLIKHSERADFEKRMQVDYPAFHITERNHQGELITRAQHSHYFPVTFIEPFQPNRAAHGFDLNSNDARRASLIFSRDSGELAATARIHLVQDNSTSHGLLIFAPVYYGNLPLHDAGQRAKALRGFVLGVFRINSLMKDAQSQASEEGLYLTLVDSFANNDEEAVLYGKAASSPDFSFPLTLPERRWLLQISLSNALRSSTQSPAVVNWIGLGGIVFSALLGFCLYALMRIASDARFSKKLSIQVQRHNIELESIVKERTETLAQKNDTLEANIQELTTQRRILTSLMEDAQNAKKSAEQKTIELTRSNKDLDDFAYVASHDLKSPLRGIDQLASWVIEDLEAGQLEEIPENLQIMRQRVQRLEALLNDLLTYSRVGRKEAKIARVDCHTLIEDLFTLLSPPPTFTLKIEGELPSFSTATTPFEQVLRNLLGNAIKHHHRNDGHLTVSCTEKSGFYTFAIHDDGPGIASEHHQQIFKMFKSLKPRDEVEGSGMGLALIKKIVEYYGGRVYLESAPDKGSTFYFSWPKKL